MIFGPKVPLGLGLGHLVSQLSWLLTRSLHFPPFSARSCVKYCSALAHLSNIFANEIRRLFPLPTWNKVQSEKVELSRHKKYGKWELILQFFDSKWCGDHRGIKYCDNLNLICNLFHLEFSYHNTHDLRTQKVWEEQMRNVRGLMKFLPSEPCLV